MKMHNIINRLTLLTICVMSALASSAQQAIPAEVTAELKKIQQSYEQGPFAKFDVYFSYFLEKEPGRNLDSMSGVYYIQGKKYYGQIGYTEFIQNDFFNVTVYTEEKLISLAKSTGSGLNSIVFTGWDTTFLANTVATARLTPDSLDNTNGMIQLQYLPGAQYKQSTINYNKTTLKVNYITYTSDKSMGTPADGLGEESINRVVVKVDFRNYQTGDFTNEIFSHLKYLKKENNAWILQELYKEYQVYLSSVDL